MIIERKMNDLKAKITGQFFMCEKMVKESIDGMTNRNKEILENITNEYESRVNEMEIEIDILCTNMIARYQPEAKYLRTILTALKMNNDLERIGDLSVNISESGLWLIKNTNANIPFDIIVMANNVVEMLDFSITSFIEENIDLARSVLQQDNIVDRLRDKILRNQITEMSRKAVIVEEAMHFIRISRCLERIGDLSTNICEDVIFMVEGKNIKHGLDI